MQFFSVSTHLCRSKNVIKVGSLFVSDLSSVAHEKLASKFKYVQRVIEKEKLIISDAVFYGMSIQEQRKLVMDHLHLPKNIKNKIDLITFANEVDRKIHQVKLRKDVTFDLNYAPSMPCLQLKNFLSQYNMDSCNHSLNNRVVDFLEKNCCGDKSLSNAWDSVQSSHQNSYNDKLTLDEIWESFLDSEKFCNLIKLIFEKKSFNAYAFLKWLRTLKNYRFYLNELILNYDEENPNSQANKLFCLKEILLMSEVDLIKFIEEIYGKFNKEDGTDMEILNFQLNEANEMLNYLRKKRSETLKKNLRDLIKLIEEIFVKFKEDGADMKSLNFQLKEAKEMLNLLKKEKNESLMEIFN